MLSGRIIDLFNLALFRCLSSYIMINFSFFNCSGIHFVCCDALGIGIRRIITLFYNTLSMPELNLSKIHVFSGFILLLIDMRRLKVGCTIFYLFQCFIKWLWIFKLNIQYVLL